MLNSLKTITQDHPNAAQIGTWTQRVIALQVFAGQGINLTDVYSLTIGLWTELPAPGGAGSSN